MSMELTKGSEFLSQGSKTTENIDFGLISKSISELNRRVRALEEQLTASRQRLDIIDDSINDTIKSATQDIDEVKVQISELNNIITEFKTTIQQIVKQMSVFARKSDVMALEKYVDLFDPSNYLTKVEIENLIRKYLKLKPVKEEEEEE